MPRRGVRMLSGRLLLHRLAVDGDRLPLRRGDVVVVAREESRHLDWEVVAELDGRPDLAAGGHELEMDGLLAGGDGSARTCQGRAFLVRRVGATIVFRGDGPLAGVDLAQLAG